MFSTKYLTDNRKLLASFGGGMIIGLLVLIGIVSSHQDNIFIQGLRLISGTIFILFLPGYFLTLAFFDAKEIDFLERFALSFTLSISVVPLLTFYASLLGAGITSLNVFFIAFAVMTLSVAYTIFFKKKQPGKTLSDAK